MTVSVFSTFFFRCNYIQAVQPPNMVRRQKLISMTDRHFEVASDMPNFSKWVREQMEEYIQSVDGLKKSTRGYQCEICEHWFELEPTYSRIRGLHFPVEKFNSTHGNNCRGRLIRSDFR